MSSFSTHNRRGAKARRTASQPAGRMPSPETHQDHRHKPTQDHRTPNKGGQSPTSLVRLDCTWTEASRTSSGSNTGLEVKLPTYHIVAKDHANPYLFAIDPHLLITRIYSGNIDNQNELVFKHVYPTGHASTRELLQRYRTEEHTTIRKSLGVNLFSTDALGDTVTVITRTSGKHQGEWVLTVDIRVRFPSRRETGLAYE